MDTRYSALPERQMKIAMYQYSVGVGCLGVVSSYDAVVERRDVLVFVSQASVRHSLPVRSSEPEADGSHDTAVIFG